MNKLINRQRFREIIMFYLFECPVQYDNGNVVSVRGKTFRQRRLNGKAMNSLIAAMRRSSNISIHTQKDIPIIPDGKTEYLIVKKRSDMSIVNAYFYAIRNAFAHGSFSYNKGMYTFENRRRGKLQAIAQIKETTLLAWIRLCQMSVSELKRYHK